jgi:hypothetical protein
MVGGVGKRNKNASQRMVWPIRNVNGRKIGVVTLGPEAVNLFEQEEVSIKFMFKWHG